MQNIRPVAFVLFFTAVLFSVVFYFRSTASFTVETDLRQLVPVSNQQAKVVQAVDKLTESFQNRVVFLVSMPAGKDASAASAELIHRLGTINGFSFIDEEQLQKELIQFVTQYRHQLLTPWQRTVLLSSESDRQIASAALQNKIGLTATPQILAFNDDPLGWYSQTFIDLLSSLDSGSELPERIAIASASLQADTFSMSAQSELALQLEQVIAGVQEQFPEADILHSGMFFYSVAAAKDSRADITRITTVSTLSVIALLLFMFRSFLAVLFPMLTIVAGVGFAFAVTHSLFGSIHVLTIVFGASLIGIVIDYSIHYFCHGLSVGHSKSALHKALLLSLATSIVGYSALGMSNVDALSQVAVFSCAGLTMAWLTVVIWAPLVEQKITLHASKLEVLLCHFRRGLANVKPNVLLLVATVVIVLGAATYGLKPGSDNPVGFFNIDQHLVAMEKSISKQVNRYEPGSFVILHGANTEQLYDVTDRFYQAVADDKSLAAEDFFSLTQLVPSEAAQQGNYGLQNRLFQERGVLEHFYKALGLEREALSKQREDYHAAVDSKAQPEALLAVLSSLLPPLWQDQEQAVTNIILIRQGTNLEATKRLLSSYSSGVFYRAVEETADVLQLQKNNAVQMLVLSYVLVALFLMAYYRSLRALTIVFVPVFSTALMVVSFGIVGIQINLFHVMAAFLILGLGLDYGIFVYQMRGSGQKAEQAILICACTSLLSFGLLAFSDIPVVNSFGLALVLANGMNLLGALVFSLFLGKHTEQQA